jgi:hypothetical protein
MDALPIRCATVRPATDAEIPPQFPLSELCYDYQSCTLTKRVVAFKRQVSDAPR